MARRVFDPPRTFRPERLGLVVGILALVAFASYMSDYVLNMAGF
jgi:hypothetical protein